MKISKEPYNVADFVTPCKTLANDWEKSLMTSESRRDYYDTLLTEAMKRHKTLLMEFEKIDIIDPNKPGKY